MFKKPEYEEGKVYPDWAISLGWCVAMFPLLWIPGWFLAYFCKHGGYDVSCTQLHNALFQFEQTYFFLYIILITVIYFRFYVLI